MPRLALPRAPAARLMSPVAFVCAGLACAAPAVAQAPSLGTLAGGGFGGLRGTIDATGDNPTLFGNPAQPTSNITGALGDAKRAARRPNIPKLRNGAFPERYPVPLPALAPYARAQRLRAGTASNFGAPLVPGPTVAAIPVLPRRTSRADDNPFGAIGYGFGSVRLFPFVEQSLGYDSNPDQASIGVKASPYSRTEAGFALQSDWSVHQLSGAARGAYDDFFVNRNANRPEANGVLDLRIDVTRDTKLDAEARFNIDTQRPGSPELNVNVVGRPLVEAFGGTLGGTQAFGRFSVGIHGLVDRAVYENGVLSDGRPVNLAFQDLTDYGAKLRLGYDVKPGLQPFAEFGADTRIHDETVDPTGFRRDSDGTAARIGTSFEFWPQFTGIASAGYAARFYEDPRLKNLTGPTADASLVWAATPLTTLTMNFATSFNETTVPGSSGIETRSIGVALTHALFRYITLTGTVIYQNNDYVGVPITETTLTESVKAEYHLTRSLVLTGTLSHQRLKSTVNGSDYTQNVALVGMRLQH